MRTPNEILTAMHTGEITPEQAGDEFRAWHAAERTKNGLSATEPQFDQQERRLLFGYPFIIKGQQ